MKRLRYWVATHKNDSDCYSIRGQLLADVQRKLADPQLDPRDYEEPRLVEVEYDNPLDLLMKCSDEGRMHWEYKA